MGYQILMSPEIIVGSRDTLRQSATDAVLVSPGMVVACACECFDVSQHIARDADDTQMCKYKVEIMLSPSPRLAVNSSVLTDAILMSCTRSVGRSEVYPPVRACQSAVHVMSSFAFYRKSTAQIL